MSPSETFWTWFMVGAVVIGPLTTPLTFAVLDRISEWRDRRYRERSPYYVEQQRRAAEETAEREYWRKMYDPNEPLPKNQNSSGE